MRAHDRIALCEAHRGGARKARSPRSATTSRLSIVGTDGYVALNAYLPPKERRGLVLIDPPFEAPDEPARVEEALAPRPPQVADRRLSRLAADPGGGGGRACPQQHGRSSARRTSCGSRSTSDRVRSAPHGQRPLSGAGLLIVNPPHTLFDEARALMPWLAALLARDGRGAQVCEWLTPPS